MAATDSSVDEHQFLNSMENMGLQQKESASVSEQVEDDDRSSVQLTTFTDIVDDGTLYFQIIRLPRQIYAWIGLNSARLGRLYAAAPTRPSNLVCVTSLIGGSSDNTGMGIARRLVLKSGVNVILASNIPEHSPMLEAIAEKKLVEKLISLGYMNPKSGGALSS